MASYCKDFREIATISGHSAVLKPLRQAEFREQCGVEEGHHPRHAVVGYVQYMKLERHVAVATDSTAHVHRRGGLAVGGQREHPHVTRQLRRALLVDQRDDGLRSLIPASERWHLPDRLGGEDV